MTASSVFVKVIVEMLLRNLLNPLTTIFIPCDLYLMDTDCKRAVFLTVQNFTLKVNAIIQNFRETKCSISQNAPLSNLNDFIWFI